MYMYVHTVYFVYMCGTFMTYDIMSCGVHVVCTTHTQYGYYVWYTCMYVCMYVYVKLHVLLYCTGST